DGSRHRRPFRAMGTRPWGSANQLGDRALDISQVRGLQAVLNTLRVVLARTRLASHFPKGWSAALGRSLVAPVPGQELPIIYSGAPPPPGTRRLAHSFRLYCRPGREFRFGAQPMLQRLSLRTAHVLPNEIRVLGDCLRAHLFLLVAHVKVNTLYLMQIAK